MKFDLICADPPWQANDRLKMDSVKRGAESNYSTLSTKDLCKLPIQDITAESSVLALWCIGSMLSDAMDVMKAWGFDQKQIFVWVKTKKKEVLTKKIKSEIELIKNNKLTVDSFVDDLLEDKLLAFFMGRNFRACHELCLIGTHGKGVYKNLKNKSQRSVCFAESEKHSKKPNSLQNRLELMYPNANKLEIFARKIKQGWACIGNESPLTKGEDISISLLKTREISEQDYKLIITSDDATANNTWNNISLF